MPRLEVQNFSINIQNTNIFFTKIIDKRRKLSFLGYSNYRYLSLRKSISEYFESFFLTDSDSSSRNGCAFHTDYNSALNSAKFELLERDSFLMHYLSKKPLKIYNKEQVQIESINIETIQLQSIVDNVFVFCSRSVASNGKCYIGLGSSNLIAEAKLKSIIESFYLANYYPLYEEFSVSKMRFINHYNSILKNSKINNMFNGGNFEINTVQNINFNILKKINFIFRKGVKIDSSELLRLSFEEEWVNDFPRNILILEKRELQSDEFSYHPFL